MLRAGLWSCSRCKSGVILFNLQSIFEVIKCEGAANFWSHCLRGVSYQRCCCLKGFQHGVKAKLLNERGCPCLLASRVGEGAYTHLVRSRGAPRQPSPGAPQSDHSLSSSSESSSDSLYSTAIRRDRIVATSLPTGSFLASCSHCSWTFRSWIPEVGKRGKALGATYPAPMGAHNARHPPSLKCWLKRDACRSLAEGCGRL